MTLVVTIAALLAAAFGVLRAPRPLLRSYGLSFARRHGLLAQIGIAVLATITLSMVVATLLEPGTRPLMQLVDAAVVVSGVLAGALDFYLFAKSIR